MKWLNALTYGGTTRTLAANARKFAPGRAGGRGIVERGDLKTVERKLRKSTENGKRKRKKKREKGENRNWKMKGKKRNLGWLRSDMTSEYERG